VAQGVPGKLRPRIFLTFGTTSVVGRQPYAPAAFTPEEIPGTHFHGLSRTQSTWFRREPRKKNPRLVVQYLNHYATPGPSFKYVYKNICYVRTPGGCSTLAKAKFEIHRDIKRFTRCILQPKSATEIGR